MATANRAARRLTAAPSILFGRDDDCAVIRARLIDHRAQTRLLTLIGPPGIANSGWR